MGLALGGAGGFGGEGGGLLQRGAVEFERCGDAEGVALAAADGPAGGECRPDGLVTNVGEVVGEQAGQVEGDLRVRLLLGGRTREDIEQLGQLAGAGSVQDAADRLRVDLVLPGEGLDGDAFAERLDHLRRGTGYSIRLTAPLDLHRAALQQSAALAAESTGPAARKAHRVYVARLTATATAP